MPNEFKINAQMKSDATVIYLNEQPNTNSYTGRYFIENFSERRNMHVLLILFCLHCFTVYSIVMFHSSCKCTHLKVNMIKTVLFLGSSC